MTRHDRARYDVRARVLKALGHPARLLMVDALATGPLCVGALRARAGSDISTVSRHLAVLKQAGVVADEKRGAQVFYRLRCSCVTDFFACVERVLHNAAREPTRVRRRMP